MKIIVQTAIALLVVSSIVGTSAAIIRTYKNEINIIHIYKVLKRIESGIKELNRKMDDL